MDRALSPAEKRSSRYLIPVIGGIALVALLVLAFSLGGRSTTAIARTGIIIKPVSYEPFQELVAVDGTVEPIRTIIIDAIIGGKVKEKFVEDGARVHAGAPIVELENSDLQLDILNKETAVLELINNIARTSDQLEQNRIDRQDQLADADYRLREARRTFQVNEGLFRKEVIPEQEFLQSRNELEHFTRKQQLLKQATVRDSIAGISQMKQMRTSLAQAQKNLDLMKQKLLDLIVRAPIDGQLSSFIAEEGQLIDKGENVGQVDVLTDLKVRVQIDEHYNARMAVGQGGTLELNGQEFLLEIERIYPTVQNNFFLADMRFTESSPEGLKRGQNVRVKLVMSNEREATVVPRGSFYQSTGGQWIYALDADGRTARHTPIRLGKQNPYFYEVLEGLEPGTQVIVSSYNGFDGYETLQINEE